MTVTFEKSPRPNFHHVKVNGTQVLTFKKCDSGLLYVMPNPLKYSGSKKLNKYMSFDEMLDFVEEADVKRLEAER